MLPCLLQTCILHSICCNSLGLQLIYWNACQHPDRVLWTALCSKLKLTGQAETIQSMHKLHRSCAIFPFTAQEGTSSFSIHNGATAYHWLKPCPTRNVHRWRLQWISQMVWTALLNHSLYAWPSRITSDETNRSISLKVAHLLVTNLSDPSVLKHSPYL